MIDLSPVVGETREGYLMFKIAKPVVDLVKYLVTHCENKYQAVKVIRHLSVSFNVELLVALNLIDSIIENRITAIDKFQHLGLDHTWYIYEVPKRDPGPLG